MGQPSNFVVFIIVAIFVAITVWGAVSLNDETQVAYDEEMATYWGPPR